MRRTLALAAIIGAALVNRYAVAVSTSSRVCQRARPCGIFWRDFMTKRETSPNLRFPSNRWLLRRSGITALLALMVMFRVTPSEGQEVRWEDLDRLGREALRSGNYIEAERNFRLALELAEADRVPNTHMAVALGS
jgi:hypothetical protein